ncbi:MAG TPA: hypothetical protein VFF39_11755 [Verrucomicrobiae bacterium]|nr:hypothetical protein [Verrucomicrobiae bacterium]
MLSVAVVRFTRNQISRLPEVQASIQLVCQEHAQLAAPNALYHKKRQ